MRVYVPLLLNDGAQRRTGKHDDTEREGLPTDGLQLAEQRPSLTSVAVVAESAPGRAVQGTKTTLSLHRRTSRDVIRTKRQYTVARWRGGDSNLDKKLPYIGTASPAAVA